MLISFGRGRPLLGLDPALGVDFDADQAERVEDLLDTLTPPAGSAWSMASSIRRLRLGRKRLAELVEGLDDPADLGAERLEFHVRHDRQVVGPGRTAPEQQPDGQNDAEFSINTR